MLLKCLRAGFPTHAHGCRRWRIRSRRGLLVLQYRGTNACRKEAEVEVNFAPGLGSWYSQNLSLSIANVYDMWLERTSFSSG